MTRRWLALLIFLIAGSVCQPLWAASCSISSTGVAFGVYDPLSTAYVSGNGSLSLDCTYTTIDDLFAGFNATIALSQGSSGTYTTRTMVSGINKLNYNLYTVPSFGTIFGNGTAGTSTSNVCYAGIFGGCSGNAGQSGQVFSVPVYGELPAGQDVGVGVYADSIIVTVTF